MKEQLQITNRCRNTANVHDHSRTGAVFSFISHIFLKISNFDILLTSSSCTLKVWKKDQQDGARRNRHFPAGYFFHSGMDIMQHLRSERSIRPGSAGRLQNQCRRRHRVSIDCCAACIEPFGRAVRSGAGRRSGRDCHRRHRLWRWLGNRSRICLAAYAGK